MQLKYSVLHYTSKLIRKRFQLVNSVTHCLISLTLF